MLTLSGTSTNSEIGYSEIGYSEIGYSEIGYRALPLSSMTPFTMCAGNRPLNRSAT